MSIERVLDTLETDRLILRRRRVAEAAVYHRLWTERDPRVPSHRRIDPHGRPTVEDIAAQIRAEQEEPGPGILAIELTSTHDVIGYCGLVLDENRSPDEPDLAFELLRTAHGFGYATEAAQSVVAWASAVGYRRLWAGVWDWNIASRRVLEKLGFHEVGPAGIDSEHGRSLLTVRDL
ncbi:UNVERIFIED_CONTAM: GNAT family N-acetyltransferase [Microbacterium sp. SLM126]